MDKDILAIQVKQKNVMIERLEAQVKQQNEQLFKLKETLSNIERERLKEEVLSENNPTILESYKRLKEEKEIEIRRLKKRLRTYTIQEKRILVKEKAFELERADHFKEIINMKNQIELEKQKGNNNNKWRGNYM